MDPWLKLKFLKHSEVKIGTFESVFSVRKCCISPRQGIVLSKLALLEITLIVTKLSLSCLKCCTMDPWLKPFERRTLKFLCVFSVSKCHLSPRLGIDIRELVYLAISLIVKKLSFLFKVFYCGPMAKTQVSKTSRNQNLDFQELI